VRGGRGGSPLKVVPSLSPQANSPARDTLARLSLPLDSQPLNPQGEGAALPSPAPSLSRQPTTRLTRRRQPAAADDGAAAVAPADPASRKAARRQRSSSAGGGNEAMDGDGSPMTVADGLAEPAAPEPMDGERKDAKSDGAARAERGDKRRGRGGIGACFVPQTGRGVCTSAVWRERWGVRGVGALLATPALHQPPPLGGDRAPSRGALKRPSLLSFPNTGIVGASPPTAAADTAAPEVADPEAALIGEHTVRGGGQEEARPPQLPPCQRGKRSLTLSLFFLLSVQWRIADFASLDGDARLFSDTFTVGTYPW